MKPAWKLKFVHTTHSEYALEVAPNVLAKAVRLNNSELCLGFGYQVHPHWRVLANPCVRVRPIRYDK